MEPCDLLKLTGYNRLKLCCDGQMLYNRNDTYVGASLQAYGEYNGAEREFLLRLIEPTDTVIEVGANIGSHTVPLARNCERVFAFEPQRLVFQTLCANLALNSITNCVALPIAIGGHDCIVPMPFLDPFASNNFGGVAVGEAEAAEPVVQQTLDSIGISKGHLLKIDVEGMETSVILGAREFIGRHRPLIYCENDRAENSAQLISLLQAQDYDLWWHLPPLFRVNNFAGNPKNVWGRNVASINMLCVPQEKPINIKLDGHCRPVRLPADDWRVA